MLKGKQHLKYLFICILIFSTGIIIGVYSNGPTAIIDSSPGEGLSGFDWFNATTGVHAPDYYHETLGNYTAWVESIAGGEVTDHGDLTGLGDDDHPQYLEGSDINKTAIDALGIDHGLLTGKGDDDHSQYLLQDGSEELTGHWDAGAYGINASYIDTASVITDSITLDGVERSTWPSGGGVANIQKSVFDYLVYKNSTSTYWVSGTTWEILGNNNDDSTVINWALSACTGSGPRKEIVVFVGNFDIDAVCYVEDHTFLDMTAATFELTSNAVAIFRNKDIGSSQMGRDIHFHGGILDGNRQSRTQGSGIDGCFLDTRITFVEVRKFYDYGMRFRSFSSEKTKRLTMEHCRISGNAEDEENRLGGLYFSNDGAGSNDNFLSNLMMINNGGFAIKIEEACTDFRINQFHITGHPGEAGWPEAKGIWIQGDCDRIQIQDGHFEQVDEEAILIEPTDTADYSDAHIISGNTFKSCSAKVDANTWDIIYLDGTDGNIRWVVVADNTFIRFSIDTENEARYAIHLDNAARTISNVVDGNAISSGSWETGAIQNDAGAANTIGDNAT